MRICFLRLALLVATFGIQTAAYAESLFMQDTAYGQFTKDDIEMLKANITTAADSKKLNSPIAWKNEKTENHGTVTVLEYLTGTEKLVAGMSCAKIKLENFAEKLKGVSVHTWCNVEGVWKVYK